MFSAALRETVADKNLWLNLRQNLLAGLTVGKAVVLGTPDVGMLDVTAMTALESTAENMRKRNTRLILCHVKPRIAEKLKRYGISAQRSVITFAGNMQQAKQILMEKSGVQPMTPADI